ncbi:unnamed protein product, partial [Prorocentrum cordatum]
METLDVLVSLARALRGRGPLRLRKEDFVRAFKTLPLALSALCMAALYRCECPLPPRKRRGAPRALQAILGRLFFAPTGRFVDDLFGIDPEGGWAEGPIAGAAGASRVTRFVIETLLGWELDEEKRASSAESAEEQALAFSIPPEKVAKWRSSIEQVLQSGQLSPAGAAKLAGKLGRGASAVFGRLAWVVDDGSRRRYAAADVPAALRGWVVRRKVQVATWELVAALCTLGTVLAEYGDIDIVCFIDSAVALGAIVRGASRQPDWNALVGNLWFGAATEGCAIWAFRVPSAQNPADAPTRPESKWRELEATHRA